jgi:replicative superfamily II helicase
MDTGSGKTPISFLRIAAELNRSYPAKFVWFLAPTKALIRQQHEAFGVSLPSVTSRTLTGYDFFRHLQLAFPEIL